LVLASNRAPCTNLHKLLRNDAISSRWKCAPTVSASAQVTSLIEYLVHSQLPFPTLDGVQFRESYNWVPSTLDGAYTIERQRRLIRLLFHVARLYSDACLRLISSNAIFAAKVITLSALAVFIDATARILDVVDGPSALAIVLAGGAAGGGHNSLGMHAVALLLRTACRSCRTAQCHSRISRLCCCYHQPRLRADTCGSPWLPYPD